MVNGGLPFDKKIPAFHDWADEKQKKKHKSKERVKIKVKDDGIFGAGKELKKISGQIRKRRL